MTDKEEPEMSDLSLSKTAQQEPLQNKVVLLVARSISNGRSLAVSLAERGADIAIVHLGGQQQGADKIKRQVHEKGRQCLIVPMASSSKDRASELISQIVDELGQIDIFIDIAALKSHADSVADVNRNEQQDHWSNPFSNFQMMSAALRQMVIDD
jgi:NAD(P)-dependent dehydrogenase (short-subunit alcohol dehydrogenase family)